MGNKVEAYKKQFKQEKVEMIVRIFWCQEKGVAKFSMLENYYMAMPGLTKR